MAIRQRVTWFVVDASVAVVWIFDDEFHPIADITLAEIRRNSSGVVTGHWHLEVRNALLMGERRGRIASEEVGDRLSTLNGLTVQTDLDADLDAVFHMARLYNLTMYDAMYLELALRRSLPLATLDRRLTRAASDAGVETLP
jgi:predicted nucleic acid-binding protein